MPRIQIALLAQSFNPSRKTMPVEPLTLIASSLSGLGAAFKLVEFGLQVKEVPIDSLIFIELLVSVQADLDHAIACQRDIERDLEAQSSYHRDWIIGTIVRTIRALDGIGSFILDVQIDQENSPSLFRRINYVLHDYKKLNDREKWLRASHTSLLSAINAMHMLIYPRFRSTRASSAEIPVLDQSPRSHLAGSSNQESNIPHSSTLPYRPRFACPSSQSLPILTESAVFNPELSPQSSTRASSLHSPVSLPETEYAYPELENAFEDVVKPIESRKSTDSLQRPSRQKPSDSTQSLNLNRNDSQSSQSTISSTATETRLWQSSCTSLPEEKFSGAMPSLARHSSDATLCETTSLEAALQKRASVSQRPSRQKPRPRPHSSFSDNVLASADLKLDSLSRPSQSSRSSLDMEQFLLPSLPPASAGDEKRGELYPTHF